MKKIISTNEAPAAVGPYSQAIRAGSHGFLRGPNPARSEKRPNRLQRHRSNRRGACSIISTAVLKAERLDFRNIVKTTVFLTILTDFQTVNEDLRELISSEHPPARSTVQVSALPKGARVEIEVDRVSDDEGGSSGKSVSDTSGIDRSLQK